MTVETDAVTLRLERLEAMGSRNRTWIAVVAIALVILTVLVPYARRSVTAQSFVVERGGVTRASLGAGPDGTPALTLYDTSGRARLNVSMRADGAPDITMVDRRGNIRAALRVSEHGVPTLFFTDQAGEVRAALGVPPDGLPALVLLGDTNRVRYMTP